MEVKEIYNELSSFLCNQDDALKELVWNISQNAKLDKPKNILLVGEFGSGKTTMVNFTAQMMDIPIANVSNFCVNGNLDLSVFYNAFAKLYLDNEREGCKGIVLIQDMRNCFLYGGFSALSSIITAGSFVYNNFIFDLSDTMFIGEIDNNGLEDCFVTKPVYTLENMDEALLEDNIQDELDCLVMDLADDLENNDFSMENYNKKIRKLIRRAFLSIECNKTFNKKIFMNVMQMEDICKALNSPISELQIYKDDLCEDYIASPNFIYSVAGHIKESAVGLHDLDEAVREVARFDSKRKLKVYKKDSLLRF